MFDWPKQWNVKSFCKHKYFFVCIFLLEEKLFVTLFLFFFRRFYTIVYFSTLTYIAVCCIRILSKTAITLEILQSTLILIFDKIIFCVFITRLIQKKYLKKIFQLFYNIVLVHCYYIFINKSEYKFEKKKRNTFTYLKSSAVAVLRFI